MLLPTTKLSFPSLTSELFICILVGVITAAMAKPRSELSAGPELLPERLGCQRKRRRRMYQLGLSVSHPLQPELQPCSCTT